MGLCAYRVGWHCRPYEDCLQWHSLVKRHFPPCVYSLLPHKLILSSAFHSVLAHPVFAMLSKLPSHDCSICGKKCVSSGGLVRHQKSKHQTNLLPEEMNQYIHIHHPQLTGTFFCPFPHLNQSQIFVSKPMFRRRHLPPKSHSRTKSCDAVRLNT